MSHGQRKSHPPTLRGRQSGTSVDPLVHAMGPGHWAYWALGSRDTGCEIQKPRGKQRLTLFFFFFLLVWRGMCLAK